VSLLVIEDFLSTRSRFFLRVSCSPGTESLPGHGAHPCLILCALIFDPGIFAAIFFSIRLLDASGQQALVSVGYLPPPIPVHVLV